MRYVPAFAASLFFTLPLPAFAQATGTTPEAESADDSAIIVTARRREENAQDVPAAMTVVGADTLTRTYTVNLNQVTQLVPTLNYSSPNPRNTAFTIRGLGSSVVAISQANDGLEPGVGFYVDQVYHARPATGAFDFTDIEQVEVLRGPQGTLFGKNTTAGAINITTKKPSFDWGGEAEVSYGEQNFLQLKGAVTGPMQDGVIAFRLSGSLTRRDGVIWNTALNKKQNDLNNEVLRGQILIQPSNNFSLRLIADWANFENECCTQVYVRVAPTLKPAAQQYAALAAGAIPGGYKPPSFNPFDRVTDIDAGLGVDTNEGGVSAIADWKVGSATITSVSAWRYWNWDAANDRDYTGLPIQITQHVPSRQDQYSQELRVSGSAFGQVDYVAGLYYFNQKIVGHPISIYDRLATYWLLPSGRPANLLDGYQTNGTTNFRTDSYGAFTEVTWHATERLAITGGIRYTWEKKDGTYDVQTSGGLATTTASLITDKNSILRAQTYEGHLSEGNASGRANMSYKLTDDVMAYASFSRGMKSGGINMSGLPVYPAGVTGHANGDPILSTVTVRPEKNTTWEAGFKTQFLDKAVTFNIDAYYVTVRDFQANVVDSAAVVALRSYLANIPKVTVKGIEWDATAHFGHLTLRGAGAYSEGAYTDYPAGGCPIELTGTATAACNLSGKGLPGLPKWSISMGGEYVVPVSAGDVFVRVDVSGKTNVFGEATDSAYTVIKGYTLVNASIGFRASKNWEVALFARNLLNRDYLQNVTVQAGNSGLIVGTPSDPRMFGITLRTHY